MKIKLIFALVTGVFLGMASNGLVGAEPARLPDTAPLEWPTPLDARMRADAHRFIARKIEQSLATRQKYWNRDLSLPEAYQKSVEPNRSHFKTIIGVVDERLPVEMERSGDAANPPIVAETPTYKVFQVRWPVLECAERSDVVYSEGLLLEPKGPPRARVMALSDADQSPEQLVGLAPGIAPESQFARRLAENGFEVLVPVVLGRSIYGPANQSQREWIYRQAFHMGRHVIGYEVQKVLAGVDWFAKQSPATKIGVAGYGEGGLIAFYSAAVDPRIDAALVSGYFDSRQRLGWEPLYRNVWGLLREFGDAEIATLVAPRGLVVEYSAAPAAKDEKGSIQTLALKVVQTEFTRIDALTKPGFQPKKLIEGKDGTVVPFGSPAALTDFAEMLAGPCPMKLSTDFPIDKRTKLDVVARQRDQVRGIERHVQALVDVSPETRNHIILDKVGSTPADFEKQSKRYRQYFWEEILGRVKDPYLPLNPRSREYKEDPKWVCYDVVLDVWPDVFAWGLLLRPKDIRPGEKRPVVVVQPGLECEPYNALRRTEEGTWGVGAQLADQGFVVFVPQNLYRGGNDFRSLDHEARSVKLSMWSLMIGQHHQILEWLAALPYVDPSRIGFYGCSYGGTTAMYIPPILKRYSLSICSANFNDWTRKIAATVKNTTNNDYMLGGQWEFPFFNMGNTFSHAEMAYLIAPRPFMVERGSNDGVGRDDVLAGEFVKVHRFYDRLGLGDEAEIEIKKGAPHGFLCDGSLKFLHKHLNWPEPKPDKKP